MDVMDAARQLVDGLGGMAAVPDHLVQQYMAQVRAPINHQAQNVQQTHRDRASKKKKAKQKENGMPDKELESSVFLNDAGDQGAAHLAENARYSQYSPRQLQIGCSHPDHIVESAALAAATPPEIYYDCKWLRGESDAKIISNAQLETVVYALQRFTGPRLDDGCKAGFFLGDGAGVGKGRQISVLLKEMWRKGTRRILWLSHCKDLREDARRDMVDCDITVPSSSRKPANVTKKVKIDVWPGGNKPVPVIKGDLEQEFDEGVFFATYQLLIAGCKGVVKKGYAQPDAAEGKVGHICSDVAQRQLQALEAPGTRFMQILEWLKIFAPRAMCMQGDTSESGPLIVFDECHKAKNLMNEQGHPTLTGVAVRHIQEKLPDAAVLYSSATGVSEPNNMAYMVRLGNFGHKSMTELIKSLVESGLGASELFSCSLKSEGIYVARQLSYDGAEFELKMIELAQVFQVQYGRAAAIWQLLDMVVGKKGCWDAACKRMMTAFWGDHLRFFKSMLMASKVEALAEEARDAVQHDYSVVIGLQSTGEASLQAEKEKQDHIVEAGTSAEYANTLRDRMAQDAEDRRMVWEQQVEEKRTRRQERLARGEEEASDLEDDDVEDAQDHNDEAHHNLLSCVSLSKMVVDHVEQHNGSKAARALHALITNRRNNWDAETWALEQADMENMLNQAYQKLQAELERREQKEQEIRARQVEQLWGDKVQDAQRAVERVMGKISDLKSRVRHPTGSRRGVVRQSQDMKSPVDAKISQVIETLEDSEDDEVVEVPKKEGAEGKKAAAASDCEHEDRGDGEDSDDTSEYNPGHSDDEIVPHPSIGQKRSRRSKPRFSRQALLDSDDESPADSSPASELDKGACGSGSLGGISGADVGTKRSSYEIDNRLPSESDSKRLRLDLEDEASKVGLSVDELRALAAAAPTEEDSDADSDEIACMECEGKEDGETMLLCDWCQKGVHLHCHSPALSEVPDEDTWYCHKCTPLVENHKVAKDILQRHQEACHAEKLEVMTALLAGGTAGCVWEASLSKSVEQQAGPGNSASQDEGAVTDDTDAAESEQDSIQGVIGEDSETAKAATPVLQNSESVVSASVDKRLDVAAAKAGGALSAAAVFHLLKKKKSKKVKSPLADTTAAPVSARGAPSKVSPGLKSPDAQKEVANVKMESQDCKVKVDADTEMLGALDEEEDDQSDDEKFDATGIEYLTASRRLALELEDVKKKLNKVKAEMRRAQRSRSSCKASSDDDGSVRAPGRITKNSRMRGRDQLELELGTASDDSDFENDSMDDDEEPRHRRQTGMMHMTKVSQAPYNYDEYPGQKERDPHPVTVKAKIVLKKMIDLLELPPNPLDNLIHLCGGRQVVAEMTGRKEMVEMRADGSCRSIKRADGVAQQSLNLSERNKFMDGEKRIAIISEAASTGISLQADKKRANNKRRIHLTLELPWSADKAIQQFGRSHRSNQTSAPIYKMLMTPAAGEFRFASSAAKRLQSLGAILKGNRDALGAGQNLKEFDIDNKYGQKAMSQFIGELTGCRAPHGNWDEGTFVPRIAPPQIPAHLQCPDTLPGGRFTGMPEDLKTFYNCARTWCAQAGVLDRNNMDQSVDAGAKHVKKLTVLLNRILGMNLQQQQIVFRYLQQLIDHECESAKQNGTFDKGVLFLEGGVREAERRPVWQNPKAGGGEMVMSTFVTDIGLPYETACDIIESNKEQLEKYGSNMEVKNVGFYVRKNPHNCLGTGNDKIMLVTGRIRYAGEGKRLVQVSARHPWDNNAKSMPMNQVTNHWKLCKDEKSTKFLWDLWYNFTENKCQHTAPCKKQTEEGHCGYLSRCQQVKILHGSLLHAWDRILQTNCMGMFREEEDDHGRVRKKRAEEGDPVEMASTKFTNADGEMQTVVGMYVRKRIHDSLVRTLKDHERSMRADLRMQGIRDVNAGLQADAHRAGPSRDAAMQQAAAMLEELKPQVWKLDVLQPAKDVDNKPPLDTRSSAPVSNQTSSFSAASSLSEPKAEPKLEPKPQPVETRVKAAPIQSARLFTPVATAVKKEPVVDMSALEADMTDSSDDENEAAVF